MLVILRADCRDLPLRRAVGLHVPAAEGRVDGHELAVGPVGFGSGRRRDALAHFQERRRVLIGPGYVPAAFEDREGLRLVGNVHLLGADRQRHVRGSGLQALHGEVERGTARGAGVLDVVDRDTLDTDLAEDHLARDRDLPLQQAVGHAGVVGDANLRRGAAGIRQCANQCFAGEILETALGMAAEHRHGDAGNVDLTHCNSWRLAVDRGAGRS